MNHDKKIKILISAGGTGGHVVPAKHIASLLISKSCEVKLASHEISKNPYLKNEFSCEDILSAPFSLKGKKGLIFFKNLILGMFQSYKLLKRFKPDVIVGFGSFYTFSLMLTAKIMRKKIIIFESNTIFGKVNNYFSSCAKIVACQFPVMPFNKNYKLINLLPFDYSNENIMKSNITTILVFGGSQGARFINDLVYKTVEKLSSENIELRLIHIIGSNEDKTRLENHYKKLKMNYSVMEFCNNMKELYSQADIVISRAGAATIGELLSYEIPSILIPYPFSKDMHQKHNAEFMKNEVKASLYFEQKDIDENSLLRAIIGLFAENRKKIMLMKSNIKKYKVSRKEHNFLDLIIDVAKE